METKTPSAPGLRMLADGRILWRASKPAVAAGYPLKSVNLTHMAGDVPALENRAKRLQTEMLAWLSGRKGYAPVYNGTIGSLLRVYQTHKESTYHATKLASRRSYDVYIKMMTSTIGARSIAACTGPDVKRWFNEWRGENNHLGKANMAISVLKAALSFGIQLRLKDCRDFKEILSEMRFAKPAPRTAAPTAEQVIAARRAAHKLGHPGAALAYAIQYEALARQWDVIGQWLPLNDPQPSAFIVGQEKWHGITWNNIDANMVLRFTPSKTENTTGKSVVIDLAACPMVMEELALIEHRQGPLVIHAATGLPYRNATFRVVWDNVRKAAGIPSSVWNRDLRAGGVTEARAAQAITDDLAKQAGHSNRKTTADVYDRAHLEAARRVAEARRKHREK